MKTIKKLLALTLVLCMVFCLSVAVFAADDASTTPASTTYEDMSTVTLHKVYARANDSTTSPAEEFKFSTLTCTGVTDAASGVTAQNAPVPTIGSVSYNAGEAGGANATKDITITLPTYTSVGIYTYTFTEVDGGTAGVTYRPVSEVITLKVTVIEQDGKVRVAAVHTEAEGEGFATDTKDSEGNPTTKKDTFTNTYSAGSLAVKKVVAGNLGDEDKEFTVKVKFTAPEGKTVRGDISYVVGTETKTIAAGESGWTGDQEVEITLKHNQTITFTNIPYNVTYTVNENDYKDAGYVVSYDDKQNGTIFEAATTTVITNTKNGTIDMGVTLDSLPYILALAVVFGGAVVMFTRKRHVED